MKCDSSEEEKKGRMQILLDSATNKSGHTVEVQECNVQFPLDCNQFWKKEF